MNTFKLTRSMKYLITMAQNEDKITESLAFGFRELSLENFKAHKKVDSLEIRPITLLIGPNSSGKTALLQSILLVKQSLESQAKTIEPLSLNGYLVNLGTFPIWLVTMILRKRLE